MDSLPWLLLFLGLVFIFIEIFFVPGVGIAGIIGFCLLMIGIFVVGREFGVMAGALSFLGSAGLIVAFYFLFFRSPASKLMILKDQITSKSQETILQPGMEGVTQTSLYPVGKARFEIEGQEKLFDVSSESGFVDRNQPIVVTEVSKFKVRVRRKDA